LIKNKFFWIGLTIKLFLFGVLPSEVAKTLFIPFLDSAVQNPLANPWTNFGPNYFPYGSVLYFILFFPKYVFYVLFESNSLGLSWLSLYSLKIPIFLADCLLLSLLLKTDFVKKNFIYVFYWLNPVLIYINYIHLQFDIFSILFLFLSLNSLKKNSLFNSAIFFSCALLCKTQVILMAPLVLAFFWNTNFQKQALRKISLWTGCVLFVSVFGFIPHIQAANLSYVSLNSPEALRVFGLTYKISDQHEILIGFSILIVILARLISATRITLQGLIYSCSVLFGILLLVTSPQPGWYYWFFPFISLFLAQYKTRLVIICILSQIIYLGYFTTLNLNFQIPILFHQISFTMLQLTIFTLILGVWFQVIRYEMPWGQRGKPLLIGITGNSGAGKNTFSNTLMSVLTHKNCSFIEGDDYHKWERGNAKWADYTHLNPKANFLETQARHIFMLMQNQPIFKTHYDHSTGRFSEGILQHSAKNIIVQGLHTFYPIMLRNLFDLKIYIDPDENLRTFWKIKRDVIERGHSIEKVLNSIEIRKNDSESHIEPQKKLSDWILNFVPYSQITLNKENLTNHFLSQEVKYYVRHYLSNDAILDNVIEQLRKTQTLTVIYEPSRDYFNLVLLEVHGTIRKEDICQIALNVFSPIRPLTRSYAPPDWLDNFEGINQLILLSLLQRASYYELRQS